MNMMMNTNNKYGKRKSYFAVVSQELANYKHWKSKQDILFTHFFWFFSRAKSVHFTLHHNKTRKEIHNEYKDRGKAMTKDVAKQIATSNA